jgi:hypothetical protein
MAASASRRRQLLAVYAAFAVVTWTAAVGLAAAFAARPSPAGRPPTWQGDVAPIVRAKCVYCHVEGGIAPFPLGGYAQARAHAQAILAVTSAGLMPPWPPGARSPRFLGQDRRTLTVEEKATIARWVRGGAPRGTAGRP